MVNPEIFQPRLDFETRYGKEPTPYYKDTVVKDVFAAMELFSYARTKMDSAGSILSRLLFLSSEKRRCARACIRTAAALLYPDGPVHGFPAKRIGPFKGSRLEEITNEFMQTGKASDLETAFGETIDALTQASAEEDLSWLKPLIYYTHDQLLERIRAEEILKGERKEGKSLNKYNRRLAMELVSREGELNLTQEEKDFIYNKGFLTGEKYLELEEEERARRASLGLEF